MISVFTQIYECLLLVFNSGKSCNCRLYVRPESFSELTVLIVSLVVDYRELLYLVSNIFTTREQTLLASEYIVFTF